MKKVVMILFVLILNISGAFAYEKGEILIEPKPVPEKVTTFTVVNGNGVTTHIANIHAAKGLNRAALVGGSKGVVLPKKEPIKIIPIDPIKVKPIEPIKEEPIDPDKVKPIEPIDPGKVKPIEPIKELPEINK